MYGLSMKYIPNHITPHLGESALTGTLAAVNVNTHEEARFRGLCKKLLLLKMPEVPVRADSPPAGKHIQLIASWITTTHPVLYKRFHCFQFGKMLFIWHRCVYIVREAAAKRG